MTRILNVATISLLATLGLNAQEQTRPDPVSEAWNAFLAEQGPYWTAQWNKATGTPKAIYGEGLRMSDGPVKSIDEARTIALRILDERAALLGRGASTFVEVIGGETARVFVFKFDQHFRGLEVVGGRADVRVHKVGVVSMFGSEALQIPADFDLTPHLDAEVAWAIAQQSAKARSGKLSADLVVWGDLEGAAPAEPHLAWRAKIDDRTGEHPIVGTAFVDANDGRVLRWIDEVYNCMAGHDHVAGEHDGCDMPRQPTPAFTDVTGNVMAWADRGPSPLTPLTNGPLQGVRVSLSGGGSAFTDANGDFTIPYAGTGNVTLTVTLGTNGGEYVGRISPAQGTLVSTTVNATAGVPVQIQLLSSGAVVNDWAQTTVFSSIDDEHRWIRSLIGAIPTSRINIAAIVATTQIASSCNAYYTGNTVNFYAAGGTCNMTGFSSVVLHEWGHGLDDACGGISQTDGLSEAWGDVMSIYRLNDPIVGRDFTTSGGFVRTALNTRTWPVNSTDVHAQGETFMGWAWQVRNGLIANYGTTLGTALAEQIVVASILADAKNQPDAVREVFILDDNDGNLNNGVPDYAVLEAACLSRTLPYPQRQLVTLAHTALPNTTDQLEPQTVSAVVSPVSGSVNGVNLVFNAGNGAQTRSMIHATGSNYLALIPGVVAPQGVTYHFEVQHSTNVTVRFPASGEYGYAVGNQQEFFFDNFEGGNLGWTHGQNATQDDWQLGTPAGRSGTSSGVAWSDPAAAFSGTNCWGNDLGGAGFNGAYAANVNNWLRSPLLNLSGRFGVKLGFKRWLTVEESIYDHAQIAVNGVVVWENQLSGHTVDTSWVNFEIPIPQADNLPAVFIEWRLISDGGLQLGGWNIDDVRLFSSQSIPLPPMQVGLNPEQIALGGNTNLTMQGLPFALAVLLFSDSQGPISIPGLPTFDVGANFLALPAGLDGAGSLNANIAIANNPASQGTLWYLQGVQWNGSAFETSNKMVMLLGN
ncbi:MAG: hypothetical protein U1F36_08010 [Planctomycetota bacterium]